MTMRDKKIVMGQVFVKKCDDMGTISGDNTEKIMAHRFFAKQKTDVSKACKMAAGGLGSAVSLQWGSGGKAPKKFFFFPFKAR